MPGGCRCGCEGSSNPSLGSDCGGGTRPVNAWSPFRTKSVEPLARIAEKGDKQVITAVAERLEDGEVCERYVRKAAIQALAQLAEQGDKQAMTAVAGRLEDGDRYVREAAIEVLAQL
eukprot:gnl/TRDRNA2_/TRDRNA2_176264_c7_seq16.p1 gnl/TRDRNA2_/TRDRNA2_176264_c7~~gnl/TRDRNA2_/TRDRNA2_176264_c7_seq16.p1  ORF type:complete len:117 (+),score=19.89 gnl/TRDRNA2_/TRDRNA2_176264_c7_seq16:96-446(+)